MDEFTLSPKDLQKFTARVLELLPVPNGGATVTETVTSVKMGFAEDGSVKGTGRSSFTFSNGVTVSATWHVLVVGIETMIIVDAEEVIEEKK